MARRDHERTTYGFTVAAAIDAVPRARRQVVQLAENVGLPMTRQALDIVELLADEVIANAVRHTEAPCHVAVMRADGRLRVEVSDTDPEVPTVVDAGLYDESGRGLMLVDALAEDWGTLPQSEGKTTWFEITSGTPKENSANSPASASSSQQGSDVAARYPRHDAQSALRAEMTPPFVAAAGQNQHQAA
ncbi:MULTISPECIES: ATP-binding protein [Streptomyces]|uniref:ATP-binding protein n=1 Tax=Streptomyces scabiei TaxID=1930 RepID=UPI001B30C892|nr:MULTISPECIES: ATP-binding protein [Streptomyces]MDX3121576.1 ATP-binding protein [Streptomyces scabiei]MDX3520380.1 ATP-binding protein [Streptomyces scabiei]